MLVITVGELDVDGVRQAVARIVGADDDRMARLDRAIEEILGPGSNDP
ncbi:MAG: hypothetical protein ACXW1S_08765 [Acidimicrobiia bacterium]